jgi:hypothetical protein
MRDLAPRQYGQGSGAASFRGRHSADCGDIPDNLGFASPRAL